MTRPPVDADPLVAVVMHGPEANLFDPHPVFDRLLEDINSLEGVDSDIRATVEESMSLLARRRLPVAQVGQQDTQQIEAGAA